MNRVHVLLLSVSLLETGTAHAQFAVPPGRGDPPSTVMEDAPNTTFLIAPDPPPTSTIRLHVGPAVRLSQTTPEGGLFVGVDVGRGAAGVRLAGTWVRAAAQSTAAEYTAELWLDFSTEGVWHPLVAAGAGIASLTAQNETGALSTQSIGVGLLRGGVQYALPIANTDARTGLDLTGVLPAFGGEGTANGQPWAVITATVAVGF